MLSPLEEYDLHDNTLPERLKERLAQDFRALVRTGEPIPLVKNPTCIICDGIGQGVFCENCGKK